VGPCTLSARHTGSATKGHVYWRECTESGGQPQGEQQQQSQQQQSQQQQLQRLSGVQQAEQTESPPSLARSGPQTRGGHTQPQPTPLQRRAAVEELVEREQQAHRMLQFTALRAAAAGEAVLSFFDYQRGLVDLVTRRSRYVPDWVRVFYATVYIELTGSLSGSCSRVSSKGSPERG
jgi:hypothetical protein